MKIADQDILFADVVERLRAAAHEDREIDAAQLHLINLHEIIQNAGPHWPLVKDRIRIGSMGFLRGCLDDEDIVIPCGDGFLVIYARGEYDALKQRSAELRTLLLEFYLGQDGLKALKVDVEHHRAAAHDIGSLLGAGPGPAAPAEGATPMFAPIWSVRGRIIASYICAPPFYDEGFVDSGVHAADHYAAWDLAFLDAAHAALAREAPSPRPGIGVSVHSSTLHVRASRALYLERLARIPPELARRLFVKIAEIERGAPMINVANWVGLVRARVRTVLLEFHHADQPPPTLGELGVWGAGYRLPDLSAQEGARAAEHIRRLRAWGQALRRQRLRLFIDNPRRAGLVRLAAEAGAAFVISDAFWPSAPAPGGVVLTPMPRISDAAATAPLSAPPL